MEVVRDGIVVQELGPGGVLGELGLLTGAPRAASARARRDSDLLRVSKRAFDRMLAENPKEEKILAGALARQVQASRPAERAAAAPTVIAVVGMGRQSPVAEVAS